MRIRFLEAQGEKEKNAGKLMNGWPLFRGDSKALYRHGPCTVPPALHSPLPDSVTPQHCFGCCRMVSPLIFPKALDIGMSRC